MKNTGADGSKYLLTEQFQVFETLKHIFRSKQVSFVPVELACDRPRTF